MSETTPGETPVERRLREMAGVARGWAGSLVLSGDATQRADAIDAGREAIALLREYTDIEHFDDGAAFDVHVRALLARCEGDR